MRAISVEDLKPGMVLARTVTNPDMVVVLSEDTVLQKPHITRLTFLNIPVVYIKDEQELRQAENTSPLFMRSNQFIREYGTVVKTAENIFRNVQKTGEVPVEETSTMVKGSLFPLSRRSGVIDYLNDVNHLADDVYNHSLRVSLLAGVIAKWMHFDREKTQDIILAGFLHDIGKSKFPKRLLSKNIETLKGEDY